MQAQFPTLARIKELLAEAQDARRPASYARNFDSSMASGALNPTILAAYEQDLLALDGEAWRVLKVSAAKRLMRNKAKHWEPLFDILSEAKAYAYLTALGCSDIQFVAPSYDFKTPDLKAALNGGVVVCEVKTLNMSDDERIIRADGAALQSSGLLSEDFLKGKLTWTLRAAKAQLDAFPSEGARKIVYLVFNPDETLTECADDYAPQLKAYLEKTPLIGVEVEIFQFPRF